MQKLLLLAADEQRLRIDRIRRSFNPDGLDRAMLLADNATLFYLTGRVFAGYVYIPAEGEPLYFVRRPVELESDGVVYIRKPEDMGPEVAMRCGVAAETGMELDLLSYSAVQRLASVFAGSAIVNVSPALRMARAVKTETEIAMIRESGIKHARVYSRVPHLYQPGMTDIEFQVEIEREARLEGCLGQFRISGNSMELYMGSLLAGDNADNPSPYDFAMGGAGADPSLPVGANGTVIRRGNSVMVDMNGNFNGYMTDMTRVFSLGGVSELARRAHACSVRITRELAAMAVPGIEARAMYEEAMAIVRGEKLEAYFMGHRQHAGFIGHGVGIEINELPVIAPRSYDVISRGNVIALEPKFVIPGTGAVGIENTYVVTDSGMSSLTCSPEEIIDIEE